MQANPPHPALQLAPPPPQTRFRNAPAFRPGRGSPPAPAALTQQLEGVPLDHAPGRGVQVQHVAVLEQQVAAVQVAELACTGRGGAGAQLLAQATQHCQRAARLFSAGCCGHAAGLGQRLINRGGGARRVLLRSPQHDQAGRRRRCRRLPPGCRRRAEKRAGSASSDSADITPSTPVASMRAWQSARVRMLPLPSTGMRSACRGRWGGRGWGGARGRVGGQGKQAD